jgi:uncharacterized protein
MNPIDIITQYYENDSKAFKILIKHGRQVADRALEIAGRVTHLKPDLKFIEQAAMLHDIGIFLTHAPELACFGDYPYICHGYLGRKILEKEDLTEHGLVCERHVGVGITTEDIKHQALPLPARNMVPVSMEEQIICYADKFFSKDGNPRSKDRTVEKIIHSLKPYGHDKILRFQAWVKMFEA